MFKFTNTEAVKHLLQNSSWDEIEQYLINEFVDNSVIETKGKTNQDIAREATAREMMINKLGGVLKKLNAIKNSKTSSIEGFV